jgi:putative ATP-dependent endonuclease of the OLD family
VINLITTSSSNKTYYPLGDNMQVQHVKVRNFRGIKSLNWHVKGNIICLVGPSDSTKTTVLDAIEYALSPKWNIPFADSDFFNGNTEDDIVIEVSISGIPDELMTENKFGLYTKGYTKNLEIINDPTDDSIPILTVQLRISDDLEPQWNIVKESNPEPKRISWRDREKLGLARLGENTNIHLTWGRGSALTRISYDKSKPSSAVCLANRAACEALEDAPLADLQESTKIVQGAIKDYGVNLGPLRPGLDTKAVSIGAGTISLHEGKIPLRGYGMGTKRLTSLAIQQSGVGLNPIALIDEIEHGLEPHRVRQLLKKLCSNMTSGGNECGQVMMTTHSPTPIMHLPVDNLRFVKSNNGATIINKVDKGSINALQPIVRSRGHALLSRKIIVCEGKTEEALCRVLDEHWARLHDDENFAYHGIVAVDGNGRNNGPSSAMEFKRIGYDVLFFGDSDKPIKPDESTLNDAGISVILWEGEMATEERITTDIPLTYLQTFVDVAVDELGDDRVLSAISSKLGTSITSLGPDINKWIDNGNSEESIRSAVGIAAKETLSGWFKNISAGERLGKIVTSAFDDINGTPLQKSISQIEGWIYGD